MSESYQSIASPVEALYKEKGSKFLAYLYPVHSEEDVKKHLLALRAQYPDATHHCYAYCLGAQREKWRANDDGEPAHSAGTPILNQLKSKGVSDVLAVVVRYYGGTKLGVSGLIQAYKESTALALAEAEVIEKVPQASMCISYPYEATAEVMQHIAQQGIKIQAQRFEERCYAELLFPKSAQEQILRLFAPWLIEGKP